MTWICGGVLKWGVLGGCGRVLTFGKNISLGLRLLALRILCMHEQLVRLKDKGKLEITSCDSFNIIFSL